MLAQSIFRDETIVTLKFIHVNRNAATSCTALTCTIRHKWSGHCDAKCYCRCHIRMCTGTWVTFSAPISDEVAEEIVVTAFESGINVFDLSDGYCGPRAEVSLGRILRQRRWRRSSYVVITKIYWSYRYIYSLYNLHCTSCPSFSQPNPTQPNLTLPLNHS